MSRRTKGYEAEPTSDTLDHLSQNLAVNLRTHVRRLEAHPCFTKPWLKMIDSLQHIANVALMEHRLPHDGEATLWENEELTVRYLLEEGKLNLCLRLMAQFSVAIVDLKHRAGGFAQLAKELELTGADVLEARLVTFEQSLGGLLRCAFEHIEAVQTTDLPLLWEHAERVLAMAAKDAAAGVPIVLDRAQPALVLRYLASVFERIETIGEERIMPLIAERNLMSLVVGHLHAYHAALAQDDRAAGCAFLAHAFDTEAYETDRRAFLPPDASALLRDFPPFLGPLTSTAATRKKLRPLLDEVSRA